MPFKIAMNAEPRWVEHAQLGVALQMRPVPTTLRAQARAAAQKWYAAYAEEYEARKMVEGADFGDMPEEEMLAAVLDLLQTKALAEIAVVGWRGFVEEDGETEVPFSRENLLRAMEHDIIANWFWREALGTDRIVLAEKNASAPVADGTSATGGNTAPTAATSASRARKGAKAKRGSAVRT